MNPKQEKSFIRTNIIINIITIINIIAVSYFMKDMEWWKVMMCLFTIIICSSVLNSFNIVHHLRKK